MELGTWISSSAKCSPELARTPWPSGLVRSQPDPAGQGDLCALGGFCQLRPIPQRVLNERRRRLGPQWAHCCPLCWVSSEGGRYTQDSLQGEVWLSKPPQQNKTVFPKSRNSQISTVPLSPLRVVFRFLSSPCAGSGREQPAGASVQRPAGGGHASRRKRVSAKASGVGGRPLDTRTIESEARSDLRSVSP